MFKLVRNWLDGRIVRRSTITSDQWSSAFTSLPLLKGLTAEEKQMLRKLAILFLHHKVIEGAHGLVITQPMALIIALQSCLPILKMGLRGYEGWVSVIIHPSGFVPKRVIKDEYGVEHQVQSSYLYLETLQPEGLTV